MDPSNVSIALECDLHNRNYAGRIVRMTELSSEDLAENLTDELGQFVESSFDLDVSNIRRVGAHHYSFGVDDGEWEYEVSVRRVRYSR